MTNPTTRTGSLSDRRWRVLAVTGAGAFMGPLDVTVVALALPDMGRDLGLSFSSAIWVQAAYLLTYALVLVPAGRLADQIGRMRLWRFGIVIFAISSLAAGLATNTGWLLGARGLQGCGGAILAATSTALVTSVFPPHERGRALGLNVMTLYLGLATGPLVGGVITEHLGWRWIFLVNLPVALAALIGSFGLREPRPHAGRPRLDPLGTLLLGCSLAGVMIGLTFSPLWGWSSPRALGLIAAGAISLVAFVATELRTPAPLLDLGMFRESRLFAMANLAALLNYTAMFGTIVLTAVLLEVAGGLSPTDAGLIMVILPAVMVALSPFAGRLSDRVGSRVLATSGMLLVAGGLAVLSRVPPTVPTGWIMTGLAIVGVGMASFSSPNTSAVMGSVRPHQFGVASGVLAEMRTLGQSLSLALLGTLAAAPLGATGARVLFGGSGGGHEAQYVDGYHLAMAVGAVIALVGAGLSAVRGAQPAAAVAAR